MYRVLDVFSVGTMLSVTLEGNCEKIANGTKLIDTNGNVITVKSVAMTRHNNPSDIRKSTTILIDVCPVEKGAELSIA